MPPPLPQPRPPPLPAKPKYEQTREQTVDTSERRVDLRVDVKANASPIAHILRRGDKEQVEIVNASYRGLFLRINGPAPLQSQLMRLQIQLPTKTIELHAVPVRVVVDGAGRTGVGARFFAMNGEVRTLWESYISSLISGGRRVAA